MASFLIADDTPAKTAFLKSLLVRAGWQGLILDAESTEQAAALIAMHPDIAYAFVDYYIPSHNGPWVIGIIKAKLPDCRIALVSSSDRQSNVDEAMKAGAEAFICTSWQSDEVERAATELLSAWL